MLGRGPEEGTGHLKRADARQSPSVLNLERTLTCDGHSDVFFAFVPVFLVVHSSGLFAEADHHHAGEVLCCKHTKSATLRR